MSVEFAFVAGQEVFLSGYICERIGGSPDVVVEWCAHYLADGGFAADGELCGAGDVVRTLDYAGGGHKGCGRGGEQRGGGEQSALLLE